MTWYKNGLRFKCTECGKCCTGGPGVVWVSPEEIVKIAEGMGVSTEEFSRRYIRKIGTRYALKERVDNYDCIFLKDKKCTIYQDRPTQCRTFPWWPMNLESPQTWEETSWECEGISEDAPLVQIGEIEKQRALQEEADGS